MRYAVWMAVLLVSVSAMAQERTLAELINKDEPAWPDVTTWIDEAGKRAELLPPVRASSEKTLLAMQVTTRSPMGAVALETCGLMIDGGWLRVLGGGGCKRMSGSLASWNRLEPGIDRESPPYLIVAHDVLGGFFAVNGGGLAGKPGNVHYFAPDTLQWEDLGHGYTGFLRWALAEDLGKFYGDQRWKGWEKDVRKLGGDQGMAVYPPLWSEESREGPPPSRKPVPMKELWDVHNDMAMKVVR